MRSPETASGDGLQRVRENREDLRDLAESDLPVARVARALLDAADEEPPEDADPRGRG